MLFKKEKIFLIDPLTILDGRIGKLLEMGLISGRFLVVEPDFSQKEEWVTRGIKENIERMKSTLGKRMTLIRGVKDPAGIIKLAKEKKATIFTVNEEFKKEKNISVITLQELFEVLKPAYLPGSIINVKIVKKGKDADEGIGYLEGGVKVIVDGGAKFIGKEMEITVLGSLATAIGKVVFGKPKYTEVK